MTNIRKMRLFDKDNGGLYCGDDSYAEKVYSELYASRSGSIYERD
ncbi:hypothetical protein PRECH8_15290 [Insulibacter thermoxylanivorax]|uniref:Uncharacterized protein n=1 Tax=Insulibacter thermoxylanivorax TaxID=2749268 RepID=A0A916QF16_9BACL|nr:hypothetical protein [Insulibacter thermoxylanivorax]GFR38233.1 hypothetical protein PRECH8_15290 [Insulibacter thermoxylanivorax]